MEFEVEIAALGDRVLPRTQGWLPIQMPKVARRSLRQDYLASHEDHRELQNDVRTKCAGLLQNPEIFVPFLIVTYWT
jgi:hypothetical protein